MGFNEKLWADTRRNTEYIIDISYKNSKYKIVCAGDSITQGNDNVHYVDFLSWMTNKSAINKGVSGNKAQDLYARLDADVIAFSPKICVVLIGTNNVLVETLATTTPVIEQIAQKLITNQIIPVFVSIPPATNDSSDGRQKRINYNRWLERYCYENELIYVDIYSKFVDSTGAYISTMYQDTVHPNSIGTYAIAKSVSDKVNLYFAKSDRPGHYFGEVQGCPNPAFIGDANADGRADSWSESNSGKTSTYTLTAHPTVGNWENISVAGGVDDTSRASIFCTVNASAFAENAYTDIEFDIKTSASLSSCKILASVLGFNGVAGLTGRVNLMIPNGSTFSLYSNAPMVDTVRVKGSILIPATTVDLKFYLSVYGVGNATVSIGNVVINKRI